MSNEPYKAPSVILPDEIGKIIDLKKFRPNPIVLFFYPRDNTSGCTKEAKDFTENLDLFDKAKVNIFGISKYLQALSYTGSILFHLIPGIAEVNKRLPLNNPMGLSVDDPVNVRYYLIFTMVVGITILLQFFAIWKKRL